MRKKHHHFARAFDYMKQIKGEHKMNNPVNTQYLPSVIIYEVIDEQPEDTNTTNNQPEATNISDNQPKTTNATNNQHKATDATNVQPKAINTKTN